MSASAVSRRKAKAAAAATAAAAAHASDMAHAAQSIISVAETLAVALAGPEAALEPTERLLIEQSLPNVLAQITPEVTQRITAVSHPLMLGAGVLVYGVRLFGIMDRKAKAARPLAPTKRAGETSDSGGASPSVSAGNDPVSSPPALVPDDPTKGGIMPSGPDSRNHFRAVAQRTMP